MRLLTASTIIAAILAIHTPLPGIAQRVFEKDDHVVYEDATKKQADLGRAFNPILRRDGKVVMIRGLSLGHNDAFDCKDRDKKNWVAAYDPSTATERIVFDRPIPFFPTTVQWCIYYRMQLSPDSRTLYLVSPVSATSGSMAVIRLPGNTLNVVHGVLDVWTIETGSHAGELIAVRRMYRSVPHEVGQYPYYPFVHLGRDGRQIKIISEEAFRIGGDQRDYVPKLLAYLRKIGGRITVHGKTIP